MYISELKIDGYKNCNKKSVISFNPGLNILVGENASGKTTIIDAIRMVLRDSELGYVTEEDFFRSFEKDEEKRNILIDLKMEDLSSEERITFLSWCNADFEAEIHLEIEKEPNQKGYFKKNIWGGKSKASAFEEETFDYIDTIYLPALRNAEEKLTNGKKSRLALLLKHQYKDDSRKEQLVDAFSDFNKSIIRNVDKKYSEIEQAKNDINTAMKESMGSVFGQSVNLQFSESTFSSILQNIKMVFFPHIGEMDEKKFRDVAINSLGYNNLLYIATVFAELEVVNKNHSLFTVLLIEEPEAHLHPQVQSKLIKYLQKMADEKRNLQIIVTTHSAVIAASVAVDTIIHIKGVADGISSKKIIDFELDEGVKKYLNRWMDITKSTLLFSKGVILVEGICEAMLLPVFATVVLAEYNKGKEEKLPTSLEEAGVSVVNVNGINFKYFFPLFCDLDGWDDERLPIRCSGITDKDPRAVEIVDDDGKKIKQEQYPIESEKIEGGNEAINLVSSLEMTKQARLYVAPLKTFEYDLTMCGNFALMADVIKEGWKTGDENKPGVKAECKKISQNVEKFDDESKRKAAKYIYEHIDSDELGKGVFSQLLLEKLEQGKKIIIPDYIKKAIIWACGGSYDEGRMSGENSKSNL